MFPINFYGEGVYLMREWKEKIVMAGFGGQGIMLMGKLLAYAGMFEGRNVTWLPSYGPEMRGGTANCMVIISTGRIASPYIVEPSSIIVMNQPSLDKFEKAVKSNGLILVNSSMVNRAVERRDLKVFKVAASELAEDLGSVHVANMVALGAYVKVKPIVKIESLEKSLSSVLPVYRRDMLKLNRRALKLGFREALEVEGETS